MATELTLRQTSASGPLIPSRCTQAFGLMAKLSPSLPRGAMRGQELRLALALPLDDDACAAFLLDFAGQGARIEAAWHGPSAALLAWALHALAATLKCDLVVGGAGAGKAAPEPESHRAAAVGYLEAYEADVRASRKQKKDLDGNAFVAWLALEEHVALGETGGFADLPLDDAPRLYEMLLESDGIEDIFVGERQLTRLLAQFKAR
jgi:hypothetical protein